MVSGSAIQVPYRSIGRFFLIEQENGNAISMSTQALLSSEMRASRGLRHESIMISLCALCLHIQLLSRYLWINGLLHTSHTIGFDTMLRPKPEQNT